MDEWERIEKLDIPSRQKLIQRYKASYAKARKKERSVILDELQHATGLNRTHLSRLLRESKKYQTPSDHYGKGRGRKRKYTSRHREMLVYCWKILSLPSSRILKAALPSCLDNLIRCGHLRLDDTFYTEMLDMGATTMDRLLKDERQKLLPFGMSTTKTVPGSLLYQKVDVRRGSEWRDTEPGFNFMDLVAHCGGSTKGQYINTLDVTDVAVGWTEPYAVLNKARIHTLNGLQVVRERSPIPWRGLHNDNGPEFINEHLIAYCEQEELCLTRGRPYTSNDQCYVEQKNWSVVRKHLGYDRYEGPEALDLINQFYERLRLYINFFIPSQKLLEKKRVGATVMKKHDEGFTPYQRLLMDPNFPEDIKEELTKTFFELDLLAIRKEMSSLSRKIKTLSLGYNNL